MASDCSNPHFHASCAVDLDTDATVDNETWLCPDCDARDADPLDSEPDIAELLAATMLTPEEHAALLSRGRVPVADVPTVLGLPRALSRHKPDDVTQPALAALIKNVARFWRHNMCVKDVLLQIVQQRVDAGMGERDAMKDADGSYKRFRAVFIDQPMREALYTLPDLGDDVSVADDTWHMIGRISNMNMYAALSPVAAAGGATMPTLIMLYMTGSGVAGDKADAISFAHAYLHKVRTKLYKMRAQAHLDFASSAQSATATQPPPPQPPHPPLPLPTVRLFDKDASSFLSHLNDCKKLAGSHDAREAFDAIAAQLEVLAAGATDEEKAAGKFVLESLPGVDADGVPVAADVVPPKPSALKSQWPTVSHRPWSDQRHALKEVFNGIAVDAYGPYMRGIAYATLAALRTGVAAVHAASTSGDVNVAAARLLPVFLLFARDSAAADMLRRYYMHTVLLCDFHAWQAIERKLGGIDRDLRSAVKDGLHEVFSDPAGANGPAWAAFQARFCELANVHVALDSAETGGSGGGAKRMLFFEYIKTYWLSPRWWTTVSVRFRALFQRAGLNTTNDVELFW